MWTIETLKQYLHYNPVTGEWLWLISPARNIKVGSIAGTIRTDGYRYIGFGGSKYYSAPLAWFYMTGVWPEDEVDHENKNRSDDRWDNLRAATSSDNNANKSLQANNTSGYRGVSWDYISGKWDVRVNRIHIGFFDDIEEAAAVRDACALRIQGAFANLNSSHGELM